MITHTCMCTFTSEVMLTFCIGTHKNPINKVSNPISGHKLDVVVKSHINRVKTKRYNYCVSSQDMLTRSNNYIYTYQIPTSKNNLLCMIHNFNRRFIYGID
jgi:hypothetical protein